jgi:serine protease inhibitor
MKLSLVLFVAIALSSLSCEDLGTSPGNPVVHRLTGLEKSLVRTSNQFGLHLFRTVNQTESSKNVFISPLSVSMALGMTLNGASGTTEEAIRSTLDFSGMTQEEINSSYHSLMELLRNLDPKVEFNIANSIWHRLGFAVEREFIETNQRYFEAIVSGLDFSSPDASNTINQWVDLNTNGKIKQIVSSPTPDYVVMYLIDAIYFKGTWTYQFDKERTSDAPFYLPDGTTRTTKLMQLRGTLPYAETAAYQTVELPYGDSLFSMIVVLPKPGESIEAFVNNLTDDSWSNLKDSLHLELGTVYLPKFKLEYEKALNDALTAMGMGIAFDPDRADFRRISQQVYEMGERLFISEVKHKTFVQVDEEGTEAAAVTSVEIGMTSAGPREFVMRVDRPFFFVITERLSGTLLFVGKIVEPTL